MRTRISRYFACDFETTVYQGQVNTEVWASASVELFSEDVHIFHSIDEQYEYFKSLNCNVVAYYHNLKFDGAFWLSYLLVDLGYKQAGIKKSDGTDNFSLDDDTNDFTWIPPKEMKAKTFQYSISNLGQWYRITIKMNEHHFLEIRDSLKLLPFSVEKIGKSFKTKHQKLNIEYDGFRYAGCEITPEEEEYIANDVLVVKEALEIMYEQDHKKLTIGSCCLAEYRKTISATSFSEWFPNLYQYPLNKEAFGYDSVGAYVRASYRGGWCYLAKGKEKRMYTNGTTADVNSLYPSMMHSESGNKYPVGLPKFWRGNIIPSEALAYNSYYFIRIRTRFYLKQGKLPFVQIKNDLKYKATEALETSDYYDFNTNKYYPRYIGIDGAVKEAIVTLSLTCTDFDLLREHYDLCDFEILDGCYFNTMIGIFDVYIDKYKQIKLTSKGAVRELAKLFLNNLYGKFASSPDSSFKVAYVKPDKSLAFRTVNEFEKEPGYIPIGSAITSYARNFTIRAAQKNYHGTDKRGFIYADTDSIHCDLLPEEINGIKVDAKNFCCWKLESCWDEGYFVRQKTYIEHITHEDCEALPEEEQYYSIKCAGMPQKCKNLFLLSIGEYAPLSDPSFEELKFASADRTIEDFNVGLAIPGKLLPKRIRGGILLVDTMYEMR